MIRILAGGKSTSGALRTLIDDYSTRLRPPYNLTWEFFPEEKLTTKLAAWPFNRQSDYVILLDERGTMLDSPRFSQHLSSAWNNSRNIIIIIGGAYGFSDQIRAQADFVWSLSPLVFPHLLVRLLLTEQLYRASEISRGSNYHHL